MDIIRCNKIQTKQIIYFNSTLCLLVLPHVVSHEIYQAEDDQVHKIHIHNQYEDTQQLFHILFFCLPMVLMSVYMYVFCINCHKQHRNVYCFIAFNPPMICSVLILCFSQHFVRDNAYLYLRKGGFIFRSFALGLLCSFRLCFPN
eukprot:1002297_1